MKRWEWPRWAELLNGAPEAPRAALQQWRKNYPIEERDHWIMDAALHTILQCWLDKSPLEWTYAPDEHWPALFRPRYATRWHGDDEAEQKRMERDFVNTVKKQWRTYCSQVKAECAARKSNMDRDAFWTARRQKGESSLQISKSISRPDENAVRVAIDAFAQRIGLTLADSLAGPHKKPAYNRRKVSTGTTD
jgi:hypothetical protein